MSLDQLRNLRRNGGRPRLVTVIVGTPSVIDDDAHYVVIDREPALLDLRPLVGLPIQLIDVQKDADFLRRVMAATEEVGVKVMGASSAVGTFGVSPDHERVLSHYRELMLP
jgi:hypothetical protein